MTDTQLKRRRIVVTQDDLVQGQSGPWCPIELAMIRQGIQVSHVGHFTAILKSGARYPLPQRVTEFINAYDENRHPKPIIFYLDLADAARI